MILKCIVALALVFMAAVSAQAKPSAQLSNLIKQSYNPKIQFFHAVEKSSVRGCPQGRAFITGQDPLTHGPRDIVLNEYEAAGATRAVIIVPPTGGENILDNQWANLFCSKGIRAVILRSFELLPETTFDLSMYDHEAIRSLVAIRQTVDYLTRTGTKNVGLLGTSLGAIEGSFATMVDDRINTATFIAGGVGLAEIVAKSQEPENARLRAIRMQVWKMNQSQYEQAVARAIHVDAAPFVDDPTLASRKKVFSIVAIGDTYVPTENQMRLYRVWGQQALITMKHSHVDTILRTSLMHGQDVIDFFDQNLPH